MNQDFWRNRRVFLTGHTGFKGAWLSLWLKKLGAHVTGYSLPPPTNPSLFDLAEVGDLVDSQIGDIRDYDALKSALVRSNADVVFHLAAQATVAEGYRTARDTFATNLTGTLNLLDAIRDCSSVKAAVIVTSDKCYAPTSSTRGLREDDRLGGIDPYSASKSCAEIAVSSWRQSFFSGGSAPRIATARAGNVIGGGDWAAHRLLPDIVRAWAAGQPITLRMPQAFRPWQHVLEALSGYLRLAEKLSDEDGATFATGWNFGPDIADNLTVGDIAERSAMLWRATGNSAEILVASNNFQAETTMLRLDASAAREKLGWRPRWNAQMALSQTLDWYRHWLDQASSPSELREFSMAKIDNYCTPQ